MAHIHTIEFQKRGLPHIHLLIFLYSQHRIRDSHHINFMILAQLPDPQLQLLLYAKVTKYMLHSPCGIDNSQAKYMVNGKCSKCFLKEYREREQIGLRTVIYFMLGLTMAWFLNAMGLDSLINMWSLTILNFSFSLIVISMLRSLLDWELSSIWASTSARVLIEQLWRLVVKCRMKSRLIWMVALLVQQKLTRRSLNLICMESH